MSSAWVNDSNAALSTDLYELTMLQSYFDERMNGIAVFDLFIRRLPENRNYFVACGLDHVLEYLEAFCFSGDAVEYLQSLNRFSSAFHGSLRDLRLPYEAYGLHGWYVIFHI